ncbi:hypothetical protein HDA40_005870 [Hamadaea flava]|uniref:Uncharacterized protein n=1 Tax=Hamadaea flava TaxID=1742688 RepID=A0ABV8LWX2_9ACTN|nr:hypothetical protein [Hamadaea flava]MCP2327363.1 hypothetical protein [Hamadaea flava]
MSTEPADILTSTTKSRNPWAGWSRRRRWVAMTGSVVGCGVLAAGITLGPTGYRMLAQKDATLTTPATAAGLTLDTTDAAKSAADDLRTVLDAGFSLDETVAGVYGDPAQAARSVLFVGGTAFLGRPEKELDELFALLDDQAGGVRDVRAVDAGPLGGVMRCGAAEGSDATMTICGWADYGSIALAMFPQRNADESAQLLRDLRTAVQHRN